ncbi:MBL fold metallo-hydrolase [Filibacter tadaridae]|uniref:Putative polyketide biosynthesis zinc-dependent hydrolase PksB n=1 Tax=Filibacter tadaridae TaxID=2483811 RepID=A0A3P5WSV9_9BACL|nr:MBL fold metallo-hydrolase [Filibacter tadaridae]VDC22391.1 putative polyketide biosynthesis zinc-dependent hydrolase PksB [Filibacter tadaridae]
MFFRSFFDENLAHMSYLVGCQKTGEAIVIDPARSIESYLKTAKRERLKIVAVAETHIHADFLSGSREIAKHCGATVYVSDEGDENWKYHQVEGVNYTLLTDNCIFKVGHIEFQVMHTAGHTPESISFVLTDIGGGSSHPMGIFTGDFVFVGEIGRPDLLEKAAGVRGSAATGARQMFESVQKFKQLPDFLQVWPAHGAGSACGKSLGAVPMSTVGYEKLNNWALLEENEEKFVETLLSGQSTPPNYFSMMKKLNKIGPPVVNEADITGLETVDEMERFEANTILLDTRRAAEFAKAHCKGAINIPFNQTFTNWAGELIGYEQDIILIAMENKLKAIMESLASIGLDRVVAFIEPSVVLATEKDPESYGEVNVQQLQDILNDDDYYLIDVRNQSEWDAGKIEGATHKPLSQLVNLLDDLPKGKTYLVQCQSGVRSAIATSLMQANGYKDVKNVKGGYIAWKKEKFPVNV